MSRLFGVSAPKGTATVRIEHWESMSGYGDNYGVKARELPLREALASAERYAAYWRRMFGQLGTDAVAVVLQDGKTREQMLRWRSEQGIKPKDIIEHYSGSVVLATLDSAVEDGKRLIKVTPSPKADQAQADEAVADLHRLLAVTKPD